MSTPTNAIYGMKVTDQRKLAKAGIRSVEALLKNCSTKTARRQMAKTTGINEKTILNWVNMADLFRIKGVATQYSMLLEASGVDTVKELSSRKPENLYNTMVEVCRKNRKVTNVPPSMTMVKNFVKHAKRLKPMVTYR